MQIHDIIVAMLMIWFGRLMYMDKKAYQELGYWDRAAMNIALKSSMELNMFSTLFTSLKATPAFASILSNTASDVKQVISGDMDAFKMLRKNIKALELLPTNFNIV